MKNVYLCGPMTGVAADITREWRQKLADLVYNEYCRNDIHLVSPLRGKDFIRGDQLIQHTYDNELMSTQRAIITRDRNDVMTCDMIVANFTGATIVSIGSMFELAWADYRRIPIILIMEATGNIHDHPFVRDVAGWRVDNLEMAAYVIDNVL